MIVLTVTDLDCTVTLYQTSKNRFTVVYGKQKHKNLSYEEAATELGACLMHSAACLGRIEQ